MNYYNEIDEKAAAWIKELIKQGRIPNGTVDTRSITEIDPRELNGYAQCHFFAGIAGWSYALQLANWSSNRPVWTGSCPCQPFSTAGKQKAQKDERHLWPSFFQLIKQCRPEFVFGEQVANAIGHGWLDGISTDLEGEDYSCGAAVLGAHSVKAHHTRNRLYWFANTKRDIKPRKEPLRRPDGRMGRVVESIPWNGDWKNSLSSFRVLGNGLPRRVDACDAARNSIVPQTAATFIIACEQSCADIEA